MLHIAAGALLDSLLKLSPDEKDRARKSRGRWRRPVGAGRPPYSPFSASRSGRSDLLRGSTPGAVLKSGRTKRRKGGRASTRSSEEARRCGCTQRCCAMAGRENSSASSPAQRCRRSAPRVRAGAPRIALVEAGTGTGKTLGYLAPASLWAERNGPGLWISTYTRNLQRQILQETGEALPRSERARRRSGCCAKAARIISAC